MELRFSTLWVSLDVMKIQQCYIHSYRPLNSHIRVGSTHLIVEWACTIVRDKSGRGVVRKALLENKPTGTHFRGVVRPNWVT